MGYIPPPIPLTKENFIKAIKNGAITLAQIDPALSKWATSGFFKKKWNKLLNVKIVKH